MHEALELMSLTNKVVVTSGVDSEYVLGGLSTYLRSKGAKVIEIDFGSFKEDPKELLLSLSTNEVTYITSAHTNLSLRVAKKLVPKFVKLYPNYLSPLEIIPLLNPKVTVYIPHDLLTPYGDTNLDEYRFLNLYDYILAPTEANVLSAALSGNTQVIEAGWIKHFQPIKEQRKHDGSKLNVVLFISMIEHLRTTLGIKGVVEYLKPLFTENVHIKLPQWRGVAEIENEIKLLGKVTVVDSAVDSISLIKSADVVICNGASSIHAESSLMGVPTVCLLDNQGITMGEQKEKLKKFTNIIFHDYSSQAPLNEGLLRSISTKRVPPKITHFNYEIVEKIVAQNG